MNQLDFKRSPALDFFPLVLRQAWADQKLVDSRGNSVALNSGVSPAEAVELYGIVRRLRPAVSVEIGLAQGISTLAILQAHEDNNGESLHHIIDPYQDRFGDAGLAMIGRSGLEARSKYYRKFADEVIPQLPRLQFAFIDSSHLFDLTIEEFVLVDKKLEIAGIVVLHDMWMPAQQKALRYILANRSYDIVRNLAAGKISDSTESLWTLRSGIGSLLAKSLRIWPAADRVFSQEFLRSWKGMKVPTMVALRKRAEDGRDWRSHRLF